MNAARRPTTHRRPVPRRRRRRRHRLHHHRRHDAVREIAAERGRGAWMGRVERPLASRPSGATTTRQASGGQDPSAAHFRVRHVGRLGQACAKAAAARPAAWMLPRLACHCVGVCWAEARARREVRAPSFPSLAWGVGVARAAVDSCDESGRGTPAHWAAAHDGQWWAHQRPSGP